MIDVDISGAADLRNLPRDIQLFVSAMANRHGGGRVAKEVHGLHLYIPCPECIKEKGEAELFSKHMSINLDKYFCIGRQYKNQPAWKADASAICHRNEDHKFKVSQLRKLPSIESRGCTPTRKNISITIQDESSYIYDSKGNLIPRPPGEATPLIELADDHPANWYLKNRGYDIESLYNQFRVAYCYKEWPESDGRDGQVLWKYRRMPGGWKDTPQGRIIFFCDVYKIQKGWQARIIDRIENEQKLLHHPYTFKWTPVEQFDKDTGKWIVRHDYQNDRFKWAPSKYRTAGGAHRNQLVMGFDAALAWNKEHDQSVVFIVEGPLDAGRIGPPAVAIMGKSLSHAQVQLLRPFKKIVLILDNDDAGKSALIRAKTVLGSTHTPYEICEIPEEYKDVGDMPRDEVLEMIEPFLLL